MYHTPQTRSRGAWLLASLALLAWIMTAGTAVAQDTKPFPGATRGTIHQATVASQGVSINAAGGKPPAETLFWGHGGDSFDLNFANMFISLGTIPVGQRLVLEYVGVECTGDVDDEIATVRIYVSRVLGAGWETAGVPLAIDSRGLNAFGQAVFSTARSLRLNSEGVGEELRVEVHHKKATATPYCFVHASGYTVAVQ